MNWRLFPTLEWTLEPKEHPKDNLVHHLQKLVHLSQNLAHP